MRAAAPPRARLPLAAAAAILLGGAAAAEVTVRSGEHPGHSRLVLEFDRLPAWQLEKRPGGYDLRFDPPQPGVHLDEVFRFIPRTRLVDLRTDPGTGALRLDLGCACSLEASVMRSRALVIDIHDPRPAAEPDGEEGGIEAMTDGPVQLLAGTHAAPQEHAPVIPGHEEAPAFSPVPEPQPEAPVLPFTGTTAPDDTPLGSGLTRALAEQLARAAAQGMVDADRALTRSDHDGADRHRGTLTADQAATQAPENIRIRSGLDQALDPFGEDDLPPISADLACPDPSLYAIASWGDERPVHLQIAELRRRLVGEFDRPNRSAALGLARLYTHLTFGTEARGVVAQLLPGDPAARTLVALSELVELGSAGGTLAPYSGCAGALPLWALLDEDPDAPLRPVRTQAVLLSFTGLPPHLRRHLGYRVAARFAARSDFSSAEIVRAALDRITGPDDPAAILSSVQTGGPGEIDADVEAALDALALSLHPEAAEALLLNIDGRLARKERIPVDLIDTASALSHELAGTAEGARVKTAEIMARLANGDFDSGLAELRIAEDESVLNEGQAEELWYLGLDRLLTGAGDIDFVRHMFGRDAGAGLAATPEGLRLALAERLAALGFPDRAAEIAPPDAGGPDGLFRARLARARGDLDEAIRLAGARRDPAARRFLADSLADAGRHAEAHAAYADLGEDGAGIAEAWRAGVWDAVADAGASAERTAAIEALRRSSDRPPAEDPPTIEGARALVDQSAGLRDTLGALLASLPRPDG